jgi:REP element-mobilizing transposase RayT
MCRPDAYRPTRQKTMTLPQRKSPRLQGYDYSQEGAYFVTVCTQSRESLFGLITENMITLNPAGTMVQYWWQQLPQVYADVELDLFVVMPNHFHGIVCLNRYLQTTIQTSLPDVMRWFKTMTTNAYIRGVKECQWQPYTGKLWQRSYHDHIIRHEADLNRIREYVLHNPERWQEDKFYN